MTEAAPMTAAGPDRVRVAPGGAPPLAPYDVIIARDRLAPALHELAQTLGRPPGHAFLVADGNLPTPRVDQAQSALRDAGWRVSTFTFVPTEARKSLATLAEVLAAMETAHHERGDPLIALGGGIVGDLAGFAAASYRRGVPVIQCPTTLLAMVDASVGGKTAVNLTVREGVTLKNAAGAFHQPALVVADLAMLDSLPPRELRCGLAECLKHGLIAADWGDPGLLDWTAPRLGALRSLEPAALTELVRRNVAIKARVVADDVYERSPSGGRALLNLGHTFAHAIEPLPHLSPDGSPANAPLQHGEAVGLGLIAAAAAAVAAGRAATALIDDTRRLVAGAGLPTAVAGLPDDNTLTALMSHDKKAAKGVIRLILPLGGGRAAVLPDAQPRVIAAGWDAIRA